MSAPPRRIAVVKPCCIGDSVMALPALASLAACWPDATLDVFCGHHSQAIFGAHPATARVLDIPDIPGWRDVLPLAVRFWRGRYNLLILLDRSRYLHTAARLSGIRHIARPAPSTATTRHESDVYLDVVRSPDCKPITEVPSLTPPQPARERAKALISDVGRRFIAIQPGGAENPGTRMVSKRWPPGHFAEILRWAANRDLAAVLTGGPADVPLCEQVVNEAGITNARILAGKASLVESAAVVEGAALYVGVDTGMSHIAAAVGTPSVVIFGPTNPLRYGPRGEQVVILAPDASSQIPDVDLRRQPDTRRLPSTVQVTVPQVIQACEQLIGQTEAAAQ